MSRRLQRRGVEGDGDPVNLSPLIDMTFLLLVFFVVSSTLVDEIELPIERPAAGSGTSTSSPALRVAVTRSGQVAVDGERVARWMVEPRVRHLLEGHPSGQVLVIADAEVNTRTLVDVVDQSRLAGARAVAVAVNEAE